MFFAGRVQYTEGRGKRKAQVCARITISNRKNVDAIQVFLFSEDAMNA
jgi:hypothetical protein